MKLTELSVDYRLAAAALDGRIRELGRQHPAGERERQQLEARLRDLRSMRRDARALAELTRYYYERSYRRHENFSL